jgi:hypothetical protein
LDETFLAMINYPAIALLFLSLYYNFPVSSLGVLLLSLDYGLTPTAAFWGSGVFTRKGVYLGTFSGVQAHIAATWAGLFTFFHCVVDNVSLDNA